MNGTEALVRLRTEANAHLFPEDAAAPVLSVRALILYPTIAVLGAGVQLLRMWDSRPLDSIWAEDGGIWLSDALYRGFFHNFTTPYSGYLRELPRLVAEPVSRLPVDWYAPAMAIVGALIVSGCALFVWRASAAHIRNPYLRASLAAMVLLLPVVGTEAVANVSNSIWPLVFACFFALLWRPRSLTAAVGAAILVLVAALSSIAVVFFLPLWLIRLVAARDRRDLVIVVAFAIGLAMQFGLAGGEIGLNGEVGHPHGNSPVPACKAFSTHPCWNWELVPAYAQRIVGGAVAGQQINGELWKAIGPPLLVVQGLGLIALVAVALRERQTRILVPLTIVISIAMFLVVGWQRWGAGGSFFYWPEDRFTGGTSYLITPTLLLLTAIILQLDAAIRKRSDEPVGSVRRKALAAAVVVFILAAALVGFHVGDRRIRGSISWSDEVAQAHAVCGQPDSPPDVVVPTDEVFTIRVPCDRLR
ncbi:MAG: hypothetical protein WA701_00535 [Solirubrobacterales bacterium]